MSDVPQGPGWWQASDDKWYPPPRPTMPGEEASAAAAAQPFAPPGAPPSGPPSGPPGGVPPAAVPGGQPYGTDPGLGAGAPPGTGPYGVPHQPPGASGSGNHMPLFVALGVVAAAVLVGLIIVLAGGDGDPETEETRSTQTTGGTTTTTGGGSSTTAGPPATPPGGGGGSTSGAESIEVVESGFSMARDFADDLIASYGVVLENTGSEDQTDLQVSVALYDANDTVVGSGTHTVAILRAGQRIGLGDTPLDPLSTEVATIEVQVGESSFPSGSVPEGGFTTSGVSVSSDEFSTEASFTVESSFGDQVDMPYSYAVFRNAAGDIVGGAFGFLDFVPANGRVAGTVSSYSPVPEVATAEVYVDQGYL